MQEEVAVNVPHVRSAALSTYCKFRNVCISVDDKFGILPQLKFNVMDGFSPILQYILRERTLVSPSVQGPTAEKKHSGRRPVLWEEKKKQTKNTKSSSEKHLYMLLF